LPHPVTGSRQGKNSQVKISENAEIRKMNSCTLQCPNRPGERGKWEGSSTLPVSVSSRTKYSGASYLMPIQYNEVWYSTLNIKMEMVLIYM
jgi:hypothetical protein